MDRVGSRAAVIKAIIFDCYGVLVGDGLPAFLKQNITDKNQLAVIWDFDDQVNHGQKTVEEFFALLAEYSGHDVAVITRELDVNYIDRELMDYIERYLAPKYSLAICSNISDRSLLNEMLGDTTQLFRSTILSCERAYLKPDIRIFQDCMHELDVAANECLFVDDKERYTRAAAAIGMQTIVYKDFVQFRDELGKML